MASPLIRQKGYLAAKNESSFGTAEALTAADAGFVCYEKSLLVKSDATKIEREAGLGSRIQVPTAKHTELTFKHHICGSGTALTPTPKWSLFLRSCGFGVSENAFTLTSDQSQWLGTTAANYIDGVKSIARGLMGSMTITGEVGKLAEIDFNFMGGWEADRSAVANLTGVAYETGAPLAFAGTGSFSIDGGAAKISKFSIAVENGVALREDPNAAGGYIGGFLSDRIITITLDPETDTSKDWHAKYSAADEVAMSFVLGTADGNIVTIATSHAQLSTQPGEEDRNKKLVDSLTFVVNQDDLSITFS